MTRDGATDNAPRVRVLVAGDGSYIGTSFADWLGQWPDRYHVDTVDMVGDGWRTYAFSGYDAVFHVAGIAHVTADPAQADLYRRVNTELVLAVAAKARAEGVGQFVFMSSSLVYGADDRVGDDHPITAETAPAPADVYGNSKWQAEQGLGALATDDFAIAILRSPSVYGPGSRGNFPRLLRLARWCPVFPSVDTRRSMLYIDHLCEFVRLVISQRARGVFWPQDAATVDPSDVIHRYRAQKGRRTWMLRGAKPLLRWAGGRVGVINKVFGNKRYDPALSAAPGGAPYHSVDLDEALRRIGRHHGGANR